MEILNSFIGSILALIVYFFVKALIETIIEHKLGVRKCCESCKPKLCDNCCKKLTQKDIGDKYEYRF